MRQAGFSKGAWLLAALVLGASGAAIADEPRPPPASGAGIDDEPGPSPAPADPVPGRPAEGPGAGPVEDPPWGRGVPAEKRARALELHREGNRLFADEKYSEALAVYERALEQWDHPGIRYNMVECLVNLGRNLEALGHVEAALRHGAAPLGEQLFRQARAYRNILERSLARVTIVCRELGARVVLDGALVFTGPGEVTRTLLPGVHAVLASKPGFMPVAQQPNLRAGTRTTLALELVPRKPEVVFVRRWQQVWVPWTVLGAGVAIGAGALSLYLLAQEDFDAYRSEFDELCGSSLAGGCVPDKLEPAERRTWDAMQDLEERATRKYHAAIGLFSVGATVTATGIALVLLNLPRAVEAPASASAPAIQLVDVPVALTPGGAVAGVTLRY